MCKWYQIACTSQLNKKPRKEQPSRKKIKNHVLNFSKEAAICNTSARTRAPCKNFWNLNLQWLQNITKITSFSNLSFSLLHIQTVKMKREINILLDICSSANTEREIRSQDQWKPKWICWDIQNLWSYSLLLLKSFLVSKLFEQLITKDSQLHESTKKRFKNLKRTTRW